jgi:hypothetical protein
VLDLHASRFIFAVSSVNRDIYVAFLAVHAAMENNGILQTAAMWFAFRFGLGVPTESLFASQADHPIDKRRRA